MQDKIFPKAPVLVPKLSLLPVETYLFRVALFTQGELGQNVFLIVRRSFRMIQTVLRLREGAQRWAYRWLAANFMFFMHLRVVFFTAQK